MPTPPATCYLPSFVVKAIRAVVGALLLAGAAHNASAIAVYASSINATLSIEGGPTDIIHISEATFPAVDNVDSSTQFPSFTFASELFGYDAATRRLIAFSANNGAANFAGGIDVAIASGVTRTLAALTLINPSDFGLFLDVRLVADVGYSGRPDTGGYAAAFADIQFYGDPEIRPADTVFSDDLDTSMPGLAPGFDRVAMIDRRYSVLVPPSAVEIAPGHIEFRLFTLGLFLQTGGAAASRSDGSAVVFPAPIGPRIIRADQLFVPEPSGAWLLGTGLWWLVLRRRAIRRNVRL